MHVNWRFDLRGQWGVAMRLLTALVVALSIVASEPAGAVTSLTQPQPTRALVESFEQERVFWRQAQIGKKLVAAGDARVLEELEAWLGHEDRHIRANVAFLFAAFDDGRGLDAVAGILADRSERSGGQGIPGAKWSLHAQIQADRYYAVHVLGELKDPRAIDLLVPFLGDPDINYKIAWSLAEIGDARAVDAIILLLRDRATRTRAEAIQALERVEAKRALPYLREMLNDDARLYASGQVTVADIARRAIRTLEGQR
jgi:HEAT repeat protein